MDSRLIHDCSRRHSATPKPVHPAPDARVEEARDALEFQCLSSSDWSGMAARPPDTKRLPPDAADPGIWKPPAAPGGFMRHARNQVWKQTSPWPPHQRIVVKRMGAPRGLRRLLQAFKPTRARRAWDGAIELRRRGLPTPAPVAFLERRHRGRSSESYYVCDALDTPYSVRSVFNAYSDDKHDAFTAHVPAPVFYEKLAAFLAEMHRQGVFFRDLSAGNLLVRYLAAAAPAPDIGFSLIDTARARFFSHPLDRRRRFCDLMRIAHPLDTERRQRLLTAYLEATGIAYRSWMEYPFRYYHAKHRVKKWFRRSSRNA